VDDCFLIPSSTAGLGVATVNSAHFLTSEDDGRTYRVTREADGRLSSSVFNERGGTSVVTDVAGNVYIAGSEVWIYDRKGAARQLGVWRPGSSNALYRGAHIYLLDAHEDTGTLT
jgi:hypothetical protein